MLASTRTLIVLVLSALVLAACGGSAATVREPSGTFTVTLDDYLVRPESVRVPKGKPLTLTVTNHGRLGHTLRIRSTNHNVLSFTTIEPGESKTRKGFKLAAGTYTMYCALANHEELGMYGKLVVG
jgi:plastocyanin